MAMQKRTNVRLPPEVNRILYVRNLPYKITAEELYDIFGKYGAIRQVRLGVTQVKVMNENYDNNKIYYLIRFNSHCSIFNSDHDPLR